MRFYRNAQRRTSATFLLFIFCFIQLFGFVFATPASAQVLGTGVQQVNILSDTAQQIEDAFRLSALSAVVNAVTYFARKFAYDTAVLITSGATGQKSLIHEKGIVDYLGDTLLDSTAELIGELGEPFGLNLCQFPNVNLQIYLQIGLRNLYGAGPPQPNCSWQNLKDGWDPSVFAAQYGGDVTKYIAEKFSANLSVQNSDFGVALGAISNIDSITGKILDGKRLERELGQGFKDVKDVVTGNIKTPAELVRQQAAELTAKTQKDLSVSQIEGLYAANLAQIFPMAASVFLNTLASQLLQKLLTKGLISGSDFDPNFFGVLSLNRRAAQNAFTFLKTPTIQQVNIYPIVTEFATCPENPGLNNCVIDTDFQTAIERARTGNPLTIAEAMEEGLLKPDWTIISPRREADNTSTDCYLGHYCYSNIQKLRKARIVPTGFEIAAFKADPDNPPRLRDVVDAFDDCGQDGRPVSPFCRLLNPQWIIKSPEASCTTKSIGPELVDPSLANRREECMDVATCILEDEDGRCLGNYGFCTEEKNIWRLGADQCLSQYNTCKTYADQNGAQVSYLSRTLDYGECTVDTVGCRAYSTTQAGGVWSTSDLLYLNDEIQSKTCSSELAGCTAFFGAVRTSDGSFEEDAAGGYIKDDADGAALVYLQKAPDYLGCYDANRGTPDTVEWPATIADLTSGVSSAEACDAYASVCIEDEVGCEAYTLVGRPGAAAIPAQIGGNSCPGECVGYDTFREESTVFEPLENDPGHFPLYFIPGSALSCNPEYAGCDEFTNLDEAARGGEGLEYYSDVVYCEKPTTFPDGTINSRTYYSWEGSNTEGFVLQTHTLLQISADEFAYLTDVNSAQTLSLDGDSYAAVFPVGSPAVADDSREHLETNYDTTEATDRKCTANAYALRIADPTSPDRAPDDCLALYDEEGVVYYRIADDLVTVSLDCHPLRKTIANMVPEPSLTSEPSCRDKDGLWNGTSCERCAAGGRYTDGACVYNTIPSEGRSCPAAANGCRIYAGNTGNNQQDVFVDSFEPLGTDSQALLEANPAWDTEPAGATTSTLVAVVSEALRVSEHSLSVNVPVLARRIGESLLVPGKFYELTFWAKSTAVQNLDIHFVQGAGVDAGIFTFDIATNQATVVATRADWQEYRLGPVAFGGDPTLVTKLIFTKTVPAGSSDALYFIDNVSLVALEDRVSLIENSWVTPESCDADQTDNFPGAMLGCAAYRDSKGNTAYTTGFESLCREKAVGCEPLYSTQNTLTDPGARDVQGYNLWCETGSVQTVDGTQCQFSIDPTVCATTPESPDCHRCDVARNSSGCYLEEKVVFPSGTDIASIETVYQQLEIRPSTVMIPADTSSDSPMYLANRPEFSCREREVGCMAVGTPGSGDSSYYRISPDEYIGIGGAVGTLCREEQVGCSEFTAGDRRVYFKDPLLSGGGTCSYLTDVEVSPGVIRTGWFQDGVDPPTPCYENFVMRTVDGLVYDIRSNSDEDYTGRAGSCPAAQHSCTELIDPAATSNLGEAGEKYYVLMNDRLESRIAECDGRVSLTDGCVLFDQTENPTKLWRADLTYDNSANASPPYSLVTPLSASNRDDNDSNLVIKVDRDRVCSEWLACRSATTEVDASGNPRTLCYEYQACDATEPGSDPNKPGPNCTHWVPDAAQPFSRLTEAAYTGRDTSWQGRDYSGYSLFNKYQITNLIYLQFDGESTSFVAYELPNGEADCVVSNRNTDWQTCGLLGTGRCVGNQCILPVSGAFASDAPANPRTGSATLTDEDEQALIDTLIGGTCKAFPEKNSPFPNEWRVAGGITILNGDPVEIGLVGSSFVRNEFPLKKELFGSVKVCQNGNCSCEYKKYVYKDGTVDYWPYNASDSVIPPGVCSGVNDGQPCSTNFDCGVERESADDTTGPVVRTGVCNKATKKETHIGLSGFCLEPDISRPIYGLPDVTHGAPQQFACLTWLPIDVSASNVDFYNTHVEAGYFPDLDARPDQNSSAYGQLYCAVSTKVGSKVDQTGRSLTEADVNTLTNQVFAGSSVSVGGTGYVDNAGPVLPGNANSDCDGSPYTDLLCYQTGPLSMHDVLQTWAWNILDASSLSSPAVLLRIEKSLGAGAITYQTCDGCSEVFHFASRWRGPGFSTMDNPLGSYGTVMHPPRTWGDPRGSSGLSSQFHYSEVPSTPPVADIRSYPYAPYGEFGLGTFPAIAGDFLERFPVEGVIREKDLHRVYFVPTSFPYGAETDYPNLLSDKLYIDFNALNTPEGLPALLRLETAAGQFYNTTAYLSGYKFPRQDPSASPNTDIGSGSETQIIENWSVWSYRLTRDPAATTCETSGLVSFCDYSLASGADVTYYGAMVRNQVQTRYVMMAAPIRSSGESELPIPTSASLPADTSADPFSVVCNTSEERGRNWFAIGMDFNADGEFLGYISRYCGGGNANGDGMGITFTVIASLNDQCAEFAKVYDDSNDAGIVGDTNKAWTNRTWIAATNADGSPASITYVSPTNAAYRRTFVRDMANIPFGSLPLVNSVFTSGEGGLSVVTDPVATNDLRNATFRFESGDGASGIPYSCAFDNWLGFPIISDDHQCSPQTGVTFDTSGLTAVDGYSSIHQLFAKIYSTARQDDNDPLSYDLSIGQDHSDDLAVDEERDRPLTPPQIYSLNPDRCFGQNVEAVESGRASPCSAGEANNVTVNERNGTLTDYDHRQPVADEDANQDGVPDPHISIGSFAAEMQFFGFADDNRMPIRRVMVDWGKGDDPPEVTGFYQNRKPFCSSSDDSGISVGLCGVDGIDDTISDLTCLTNADCPAAAPICFGDGGNFGGAVSSEYTFSEFGNSARACTTNRFRFTYEYDCSQAEIDLYPEADWGTTVPWIQHVGDLNDPGNDFYNVDAYRRLTGDYGLDTDDPVCVFRPQVQLKDNWGWCTGSCGGAGNTGCYSGDGQTQCEDDDRAWIPYRGTIVVVPAL